ncbi:nuclear transport factor 2 family protein [Sphingomonas sp.]|uniref:nuclear transport factor 2 family protein n=1 Tax=Sphingomonas sp. TaxID=28214 RepID=UPI002DD6512C|nr:nuclear transport factor 2 family protein [Sphingomonas sp.]
MSLPPEIQALLDKQAITDVINLYLRGADRAEIALIADAYHPDAIEDHGGVYNGPASDYVALMAKMLPRGGIMNHLATNIVIELDGDVAHAEHYILAFARMKEKGGEKFDTLTLARAIDRFERRDGQWKIAHRRLAWEWNHEMPFAESWGRGMMFPDGTELVRGAKHPADVLYSSRAA